MFNKYWNMFINWIKSSKPSNDIDEMNETQSEMMTYKLKLDTNEYGIKNKLNIDKYRIK